MTLGNSNEQLVSTEKKEIIREEQINPLSEKSKVTTGEILEHFPQSEKEKQLEGKFFSVQDILSRLTKILKKDETVQEVKTILRVLSPNRRVAQELPLSKNFSTSFSIKDGKISINLDKFKYELKYSNADYFRNNYDYIIHMDSDLLRKFFTQILKEFNCIEDLAQKEQNNNKSSKIVFNLPRIIEQDYAEFPYLDVEGTPIHEISSDIVLLSSPHYNTTAMNRPFPWKGKHAWAIRRSDVEDFLAVYKDGDFVEVTPNDGAVLYAIDFKETDDYVCAIPNEVSLPAIEKFDPEKHIVQEGNPPVSISGSVYDDYDDHGYDPKYFITIFQVLIRDSLENRMDA